MANCEYSWTIDVNSTDYLGNHEATLFYLGPEVNTTFQVVGW